jgi:hypothetical protein
MGEKTGRRNEHGVKDANDCWRTIGGVRWNHWMSCHSASVIRLYRDAGLRVRRFGEELYMHPEDEAQGHHLTQQNENMFT